MQLVEWLRQDEHINKSYGDKVLVHYPFTLASLASLAMPDCLPQALSLPQALFLSHSDYLTCSLSLTQTHTHTHTLSLSLGLVEK